MQYETIPCRLCGEPTPMLGTKLCDRCWELKTRIEANPGLATKVLESLKSKEDVSKVNLYGHPVNLPLLKVYKALELVNGKLVSTVAGRGKPDTIAYAEKCLEYAEGEITYAPEAKHGYGIFIFDDIVSAEKQLKNYCTNGVIHEAYALGHPMRTLHTLGIIEFRTFPAILLGKEVWRQVPSRKDGIEWVDVTSNCFPRLVKSKSSDGYYCGIYYKDYSLRKDRLVNRLVAILGADKPKVSENASSEFKIEKAEDATWSFRVWRKVARSGENTD